MASSKIESNITPNNIQRSITPSRTFFCSSSSFNPVSSSPSVCFSSIDHRNRKSSDRSIASSSSPRERNQNQNQNQISGNHRNSNGQKKKKCTCSPTTHPGSFRCSLHRNNVSSSARNVNNQSNNNNARRSAMANSIMRIGTVEGDLVKRYLASLIRPSSPHRQKRRGEFQPKPSRLSIMSKADT